MPNQYSLPHKERKKSGAAPDRNTITFSDPNVVDESKDSAPKVPPRPTQPRYPSDDPFEKYRVSQT